MEEMKCGILNLVKIVEVELFTNGLIQNLALDMLHMGASGDGLDFILFVIYTRVM